MRHVKSMSVARWCTFSDKSKQKTPFFQWILLQILAVLPCIEISEEQLAVHRGGEQTEPVTEFKEQQVSRQFSRLCVRRDSVYVRH